MPFAHGEMQRRRVVVLTRRELGRCAIELQRSRRSPAQHAESIAQTSVVVDIAPPCSVIGSVRCISTGVSMQFGSAQRHQTDQFKRKSSVGVSLEET